MLDMCIFLARQCHVDASLITAIANVRFSGSFSRGRTELWRSAIDCAICSVGDNAAPASFVPRPAQIREWGICQQKPSTC